MMESTNIILLQTQGKQSNLGPLVFTVILQNTRTKQENKDISIGTRIMKTGLNQVLTQKASGLVGCYGINQPLKKVMMILEDVSFNLHG